MITSSIVVFLIGIILAMVPLIEAKGAIPLVMSNAIFGEFALSPTTAFFSAILGSIVASFLAVIIFLPLRKILEKIKFFRIILAHCDKVVNKWLSNKNFTPKIKIKPPKTTKQSTHDLISFTPQNIPHPHTKRESLGKMGIVFTFCALPIPSGVWSASALCSILKLNFWQSVFAVIIGNTTCSMIVLLFCAIFSEFIDLIICIICIIVIMMILYSLVKFLLNKIDKKHTALDNNIKR